MNRTMNTFAVGMTMADNTDHDETINVAREERQSDSKRQVRYSKCGRMGHLMNGCGRKNHVYEYERSKYRPQSQATGAKAAFATKQKWGVCKTYTINIASKREFTRYKKKICSGASEHVITDVHLFTNLEEIESTQIELSNRMVVT